MNQQRIINPTIQGEPTIIRWLWALEDARQRTKRCLKGISSSIVDWIPPTGNSIGTLLYHLVAIEMSYLFEDILQIGWCEELEPILVYDVRDPQGQLTIVQGENLNKHLTRLDRGRSLLLKTVSNLSLDDFYRPRQMDDYDITPEWVIHHLMQHEAEHRGQIILIRQQAGKNLT